MKVVVSPEAQLDLNEIWVWNAETFGVRHADAYLAFLEREIASLAKNFAKGRQVGARGDLLYIQIRRKAKGHAHLAVYAVGASEIRVIKVFHSSQDWESKLDRA